MSRDAGAGGSSVPGGLFSGLEKINPAVTFAEAEAVHRRRYRAMTPVQRLRLAEEFSRMGREMAVRLAKAAKGAKK